MKKKNLGIILFAGLTVLVSQSVWALVGEAPTPEEQAKIDAEVKALHELPAVQEAIKAATQFVGQADSFTSKRTTTSIIWTKLIWECNSKVKRSIARQCTTTTIRYV